ncbi:MAG: 3-hydroxyacyl-CoA dehydrogenase family protein [Halanaerobiales bacterium]|nr:3-hydroxyacyl-CoA dehydrogenase family protein [Halanaerobiales bacterium]
MKNEIKRVSVIGHGLMGRSVIHAFAEYDFEVIAIKKTESDQRLEEYFAKEVEKGRISEEKFEKIWSRINVTTELKQARDSDLIIETITENPKAKSDLFEMLGEICSPETIFSSNTSSIPIGKLANASKRPDKTVGLHYMWPVPEMKLVEVVRGLETSDETIDLVVELSKKINKIPVVVKDFPGFVSSRLITALINEAAEILMQGVADVEAIDTIARLGLGFPMGPLRLGDQLGLDTAVNVMDNIYFNFKDSKYRISPLIRTMVESGYCGKKNGKGFYNYKRDKK